MDEELKKKMADGRRRAAEARRLAKEQNPAAIEHAIPAGHTRDEALKSLADDAQEHTERLYADTGAHDIDPRKLDVKHVDNEIARHWRPEQGDIPISNPQVDYAYAWVTHGGSHGQEAQTSIRAMHSRLEGIGWHVVDGDMPEGKEFIGKDCTAATSQRGVGDTFLWRIKKEHLERAQRLQAEKDARRDGIETDFAHAADSTGVSRSLDPSMLSRVYGADRMRPVTYSAAFSPEQIRNGNGPLKPGFEYQQRGRR